jgi:hypothetical protein
MGLIKKEKEKRKKEKYTAPPRSEEQAPKSIAAQK